MADATAELVPQCLKGAVELETLSTRLTAKLRAVWTTMKNRKIKEVKFIGQKKPSLNDKFIGQKQPSLNDKQELNDLTQFLV